MVEIAISRPQWGVPPLGEGRLRLTMYTIPHSHWADFSRDRCAA